MKSCAVVCLATILVSLAACSTSHSTVSYQAPAASSRIQERIIRDFSLEGVTRLPTGYIDPHDLSAPLQRKFPPATPRSELEAFISGKSWPDDVVVRRDERFIRIYYYRVDDPNRLIIQRYTVWIRFTDEKLVDKAFLFADGFFGGKPSEMPTFLLRTQEKQDP